MSRIIKNIIETAWPTINTEYILVHNNSKDDLEIVRTLDYKAYTIEKNNSDTNNILQVVEERELANNLFIRPNFVINTNLGKYQVAKNLSEVLRIPLINYFFDISNIKKEGVFSIAPFLDKDINFVSKDEIGVNLFLTNYQISNINNIKTLIEDELKKWKLI